jgi:D-alanyl-D-alanine endopeptidase (penicillin-binding protein 7)
MSPRTGKIFYSFKPDKIHPAASLTKLVQALTMLDRNPNWNKTVSIAGADEVGGGRLRVNVGTKLPLRDLWYASLVSSANNAANSMSRNSGLGTKAFISAMNAKAKNLKATSSKFVDSSGIDPKNVTTASDIAKIARAAFSQPLISDASQRFSYTYKIPATGEERVIKSTNLPFLQDDDVWMVGAKTGYLPESKYNLAAELRPVDTNGKPDKKQEVLVIVLGAPSSAASFASAKRMAEWAWSDPSLFATIERPTLVYGMTSEHVSWAQTWLAKDKSVYPDGRVTGFFGPLTREAVRKFQVKHGIAKTGDSGYGVIGPATLAKLEELELAE